MKINGIIAAGCLLLAAITLPAAPAAVSSWNQDQLQQAPPWHDATGFASSFPNIRAIFYRGPGVWNHPSTQVFAWIGIPTPRSKAKLPAMVLIHGGGGTAFDEWVKLWNDRGYVAIAMDTCGCVPGGSNAKRPRHPDGGPGGWGGFSTMGHPLASQWAYHAVADIVLANSLLRSLPEVDPERIGLTGISWGGYLTCLAAAVDPRFKVAIPVYGCGFYQEPGSRMRDALDHVGTEKAGQWLAQWDASQYLGKVKMPILWVSGTNDAHFPLTALKKSFNLSTGQKALCIKVRLEHSQGAGQNQPEIFAFADAALKNTAQLPAIGGVSVDGNTVRCEFTATAPIDRAMLVYTADKGFINVRKWQTAPAVIKNRQITAVLPSGTSAWYFNIIDRGGLTVSSEPVINQ